MDRGPASANNRYRPNAGVGWVSVEGEAIVIDLHRDRYLAFDGLATSIWAGMAAGRPTGEVAEGVEAMHGLSTDSAKRATVDHIKEWLADGLIDSPESVPVSDLRFKVDPSIPCKGMPAALLSGARMTPVVFWRVLVAKRWVASHLPAGLARTLEALQAGAPDAVGPTSETVTALAAVVRVFAATRVAFRQGADDCLPRSIQLARAIHACGIPADVCIGVRKFPFGAHAWVESCGFFVAERPSRVRELFMIARL